MNTWSIYRRDDGSLVNMTLQADEAELAGFMARHPFWAAIAGTPPPGCGYVRQADGGGVEFDAERRPACPSEHHSWDAAAAAWVDEGARELEQRQAAIAALEAGTLRALREHALGVTGAAARLQAIEAGIAPHREAIAAVRAARQLKGYNKG